MVNQLRHCEICKQTFTTQSAYHRHKTRMHVKRFCRWCDHEEGRLYLLRDHVRKQHPWVNANGSPDVLYQSEDVPIERDTSHLFPTPKNYSPYSPEEITQPLVTYTPTPRVLLSTPSMQVTSFRPIAPKLSSTETPTIVCTMPISPVVPVTPTPATVSAPVIPVTPKRTPPAAALGAPPRDEMPPETRAAKKPRKLGKDQRMIVVAHCQEKPKSATYTVSASQSPASVAKSPPDQSADGHGTPTSDWDVVDNEIELLEPVKISLETYRQRRTSEEETCSRNPEAPETDTSSTATTSGMRPDQSWFHLQQSVQQILNTTEQKSAKEVWNEVRREKKDVPPPPSDQPLDLSVRKSAPAQPPNAPTLRHETQPSSAQRQPQPLDLTSGQVRRRRTLKARQALRAARRRNAQPGFALPGFVVPRKWEDMLRPVTNVTFEAPDEFGFRKWQGHPALFFLGAPSEFNPSMQGRIMRRFRHRAQLTQGYEGVRHQDLGLFMVLRQERATLPDGTRYECEATWVENPRAKEFKTKSTQYDEDDLKSDTDEEAED